jgi:hypothetical protein
MCTLATSTLPFTAQICVLRPLKVKLVKTRVHALPLVAFKCSTAQICVLWSLHKCVYFGHFTKICTLVTSQKCVLWPLQPYLLVHRCVYFGHLNHTFQWTNTCTSFILIPAADVLVLLRALPLVALKCSTEKICVLWPLQLYLPVHEYVYFGR